MEGRFGEGPSFSEASFFRRRPCRFLGKKISGLKSREKFQGPLREGRVCLAGRGGAGGGFSEGFGNFCGENRLGRSFLLRRGPHVEGFGNSGEGFKRKY